MTDFLVAALQITSTSNVEANFAEAEEQIELAARRGAELIGLPENFAFLGEDDEKLRLLLNCPRNVQISSKPCHKDIKYFFWEVGILFLLVMTVILLIGQPCLGKMDRFWQNMTRFTYLMLICQMEIYTRNHPLFYLEQSIHLL